MLSAMLVSRKMSSVVTEQMAAILRCKQPATEERQIRGSGRTKRKLVANIKMIIQSLQSQQLQSELSEQIRDELNFTSTDAATFAFGVNL